MCALQPKSSAFKKKVLIHASTADEAIEKMLEQKKISTKINYDILKELNVKSSTSPARQIAESPKGATPGAQRLTGRYRKPTNVPLSLGTPLSSLGKRWVKQNHSVTQSI